MAEAIEGGRYKDATGDGYHDANGKPIQGAPVASPARKQSTGQFTVDYEAEDAERLARNAAAINEFNAAAQAPAPPPQPETLVQQTERLAQRAIPRKR